MSRPNKGSFFSQMLRQLLDATGALTRTEWAKLLNVTPSAISHWVNDRTLPSPSHLREIIQYLEDSDGDHERLLRQFRTVSRQPVADITHLADRISEPTLERYMLIPLQATFQRTLAMLPSRKQEEQLQEAIASALRAEGPAQAATSKTASGSPRRVAERRARRALKDLDASSICLYLEDPDCEGRLHLALMVGVAYPEPMHGPVFQFNAGPLSIQPNDELWVRDAQTNGLLRNPDLQRRARDLVAQNPLYGDFIDREGVVSCARLQRVHRQRLQAVLFVNFRRQEDFEGIKSDVRELFDDLLADNPCRATIPLTGSLKRLESLPLRLQSFLHNKPRVKRKMLQEGLETILEDLMDAFDLKPREALGTVHVYDRESDTLRLVAEISSVETESNLDLLSVPEGRGLISWAALRQTSIAVNDLEESNFYSIYETFRRDVRSELVIPMLSGGDLVGVLNLESTIPGVFPPEVISPLAWAVNQMTLLWQNLLVRRYVDLLEGVIEAVAHGRETLDHLAGTAKRELELATWYDIWKYDAKKESFTNTHGASYELVENGEPREDGWSSWVAKNKQFVFLYDIQSSREFEARQWKDNGWKEIGWGGPTSINPRNQDLGVRAQLGVPLLVKDLTVGVLWIKYDCHENPPALATLGIVRRFAEQASKVLLAAA